MLYIANTFIFIQLEVSCMLNDFPAELQAFHWIHWESIKYIYILYRLISWLLQHCAYLL